MRACSSACIRKKRIEIFRTLIPTVAISVGFWFCTPLIVYGHLTDALLTPLFFAQSQLLVLLSCLCPQATQTVLCSGGIHTQLRTSLLQSASTSAWSMDHVFVPKYEVRWRRGERQVDLNGSPPCTRQYPLRWGRAVILLAIIWTSSENQSHPIIKHKCCSF